MRVMPQEIKLNGYLHSYVFDNHTTRKSFAASIGMGSAELSAICHGWHVAHAGQRERINAALEFEPNDAWLFEAVEG